MKKFWIWALCIAGYAYAMPQVNKCITILSRNTPPKLIRVKGQPNLVVDRHWELYALKTHGIENGTVTAERLGGPSHTHSQSKSYFSYPPRDLAEIGPSEDGNKLEGFVYREGYSRQLHVHQMPLASPKLNDGEKIVGAQIAVGPQFENSKESLSFLFAETKKDGKSQTWATYLHANSEGWSAGEWGRYDFGIYEVLGVKNISKTTTPHWVPEILSIDPDTNLVSIISAGTSGTFDQKETFGNLTSFNLQPLRHLSSEKKGDTFEFIAFSGTDLVRWRSRHPSQIDKIRLPKDDICQSAVLYEGRIWMVALKNGEYRVKVYDAGRWTTLKFTFVDNEIREITPDDQPYEEAPQFQTKPSVHIISPPPVAAYAANGSNSEKSVAVSLDGRKIAPKYFADPLRNLNPLAFRNYKQPIVSIKIADQVSKQTTVLEKQEQVNAMRLARLLRKHFLDWYAENLSPKSPVAQALDLPARPLQLALEIFVASISADGNIFLESTWDEINILFTNSLDFYLKGNGPHDALALRMQALYGLSPEQFETLFQHYIKKYNKDSNMLFWMCFSDFLNWIDASRKISLNE